MCVFPVVVVSVESREAHLSSLVVEAERRAADLAAQAQKDGLLLEACHKDKQLKAWEWRSKLYKRMRTGFQHARESLLMSRKEKQTHSVDTWSFSQILADVYFCIYSTTGRVCCLLK